MLKLSKARLGVIGGSGLYSLPGIEVKEELELVTPFGYPSDLLCIGHFHGMEIVFLARHGRHHQWLPSEIPYMANIWAMRKLGVRWLISLSAVGSLKDYVRPRDMVVPDQLIDRTHQRQKTFFGDGCVAHVSLAEPFCPKLSNLLSQAAKENMPATQQLHQGGTYICIEGPAFSTKAESSLYRSWGCSIIGMTNSSEARLAREAELAYSSLSMVTDFDSWQNHKESVHVEMIMENLKFNVKSTTPILLRLIQLLNNERPTSTAHTALSNAIITPKEHVAAITRERIDLLTSPYWGEFKALSSNK